MSASKLKNVKSVDMSIVSRIEKENELLEILDKWIMYPDKECLNRLNELSKLINDIYNFKDNLILYRGFRLNGIQDYMGIKKKDIIIGNTLTYNNDENPLSFSTDIAIAREFGNIVIKYKLNIKNNNYLIITDELSYIINKRRNLIKNNKFETQDEVILLPPYNINFSICEYNKKNIFSLW